MGIISKNTHTSETEIPYLQIKAKAEWREGLYNNAPLAH